MMKIYTGGGDGGKTSLFSGERVSKGHLRIESYGDVDELNSILGALLASLPEKMSQHCRSDLLHIQEDLFTIGACLATTPDSPDIARIDNITPQRIKAMESAIDAVNDMLPDLHAFILPGGHLSSCWAHLARTVCRRAERHVVRLQQSPESDPQDNLLGPILIYLNRLSDYLFVLARCCNHVMNVPEELWEK